MTAKRNLHKLICGTLPAFLGSWFGIDKLGKRILWASHCFHFDIYLQNRRMRHERDNLPLCWNREDHQAYDFFFFFFCLRWGCLQALPLFTNTSMVFPLFTQTPPSSNGSAYLSLPSPPSAGGRVWNGEQDTSLVYVHIKGQFCNCHISNYVSFSKAWKISRGTICT